MLLELGPQLLPVSGGIELGAPRDADLRANPAGQIVAARHLGYLLPNGHALGIALGDQLGLGSALGVLLLVAGAVLEGKGDGHLALLVAHVLHIPDEDGAGQTRFPVLVRYDRRHLTANQPDTVVGEIVLGPGAWIEAGVLAPRVLDVRVPGTQWLLGATAAIGQLTFSFLPIGVRIRRITAAAAAASGAGYGCVWVWWGGWVDG